MKIKYVGGRPFLSTVLSSRKICYFGKENDYTIDVEDATHISELLRSVQHKFIVVLDEPKKPVVEKKKEEEAKKPVKKSKKSIKKEK